MGLNKLFYSEVFLIIENGHFEAVCTKDMLLNKKCFYLHFCSRLQYFNQCGSLSYTSYLNFVGFINKQQIFVQNYQTSPTTLLFRIHNRSDKEVKKKLKTLFYIVHISIIQKPQFHRHFFLSTLCSVKLCGCICVHSCSLTNVL